jgi:hypothetical protein
MDELDQAAILEADFVARSIEANRKTINKLQARGTCYNCAEEVAGQQLFCDGHCREDYQIRTKRSKGYSVFSGAV